MKILVFASDLMIPLVFVYIILYGYSKRIDIYNAFIEGAKDGMKTTVKIMPTLTALMVAVGMLRTSGFLDMISHIAEPLAEKIGFPHEAVPLMFMRLVSSSASTGILLDIFKTYGADSYIGRFVSVMMSCTETVFYTMSIYFMAVKITKTRYTLAGALIANLVGTIASLWICKIMWG